MYRYLRLATATALLLVVAVMACTTKRDTPLGSTLPGDLLGTKPGEVFADSMELLGPSTITYHSLITSGDLVLGRQDGYSRTVVLRPNIADAAADTALVVASARLQLRRVDDANAGQQVARFYELGTEYSEGDSIAVLDTTQVIPDPISGMADRSLELAVTLYDLPAALVQAWIRGQSPSNGIAIVYTGANDQIRTLRSREFTGGGGPQLQVSYVSGASRIISVSDDATFVQALAPPPSDVTIGDGLVRRVHFRVDTAALPDSAAVHNARVRFHLVPGSLFGTDLRMVLFVPDSPDPASASFLRGTDVTGTVLPDSASYVELPVTLTLLAILSGNIGDNGFILRFADENTEIRQASFYGALAADSLRPRLYFTASTPGTFTR